jgi:polyisoprenoid-binding protein YceI
MSSRTIDSKTAPAAGTWEIDASHSDLQITARHLMVTKVRGTFADLSGTIVVAEDPTQSTVNVTAQAASVSTGSADRDAHILSPDFLDAENFSLVTFLGTRVAPSGDNWELTGDLTIRGVTKSVTFAMSFEGVANDPFGNTKAAFTATGSIDREDWGLTWNVPLETGGVLVSKKLLVEFDVQAVLQA